MKNKFLYSLLSMIIMIAAVGFSQDAKCNDIQKGVITQADLSAIMYDAKVQCNMQKYDWTIIAHQADVITYEYFKCEILKLTSSDIDELILEKSDTKTKIESFHLF